MITVRREGDEFPGFGGGKVETPDGEKARNLDPVSCCIKEGEEEFGFPVRPMGIIGCRHTALEVPEGRKDNHYVSIENVCFGASPINPKEVAHALKNPKKYLEKKMAEYVVETITAFRDRVDRGHLRMPDNVSLGKELFRTGPGDKPNLFHIRDSGAV